MLWGCKQAVADWGHWTSDKHISRMKHALEEQARELVQDGAAQDGVAAPSSSSSSDPARRARKNRILPDSKHPWLIMRQDAHGHGWSYCLRCSKWVQEEGLHELSGPIQHEKFLNQCNVNPGICKQVRDERIKMLQENAEYYKVDKAEMQDAGQDFWFQEKYDPKMEGVAWEMPQDSYLREYSQSVWDKGWWHQFV